MLCKLRQFLVGSRQILPLALLVPTHARKSNVTQKPMGIGGFGHGHPMLGSAGQPPLLLYRRSTWEPCHQCMQVHQRKRRTRRLEGRNSPFSTTNKMCSYSSQRRVTWSFLIPILIRYKTSKRLLEVVRPILCPSVKLGSFLYLRKKFWIIFDMKVPDLLQVAWACNDDNGSISSIALYRPWWS